MASNTSTRRGFLKAGALLSAPLAATPVAALADDGLKARLARLENESAIRSLHQSWLRGFNAGDAGDAGDRSRLAYAASAENNVRSIAASHAAPPDEIKIGANGRSATGRFHCAVELETVLAKDCTAAQMAHLQGGGFVRHTESSVLTVHYVKTNGAWSIAKAELAAAQA